MRKTRYALKAEQENLFGVCEVFEGPIDALSIPERTIDLVAMVGAKSMRLWMHHSDILRLDQNGEPEFIEEKLKAYKAYTQSLTKKGVNHLVSMCHCYLYPKGYKGATSWNVIPLPESAEYLPFMELLRKTFRLVAKTFPEIKHFEVGNEVNFTRFLSKPGYNDNYSHNHEKNRELSYTEDEKAEIVTDICYYANKGVLEGNPNALTVFPSPTGGKEMVATFYEKVYTNIESGRFPRGGKPDTDADNYFQILSWHPYNFDGNQERFIDYCKGVYDVAIKHGDNGKKVFLTEIGYYDYDLVKFGLTETESDIRQASYLVADFEMIRNELPFIETAHVFRLYDWYNGPGMEKSFGLFTTPRSKNGIIPKAKGLAMFKYFKGARADIRPLYKYSILNIQGDAEFNKESDFFKIK